MNVNFFLISADTRSTCDGIIMFMCYIYSMFTSKLNKSANFLLGVIFLDISESFSPPPPLSNVLFISAVTLHRIAPLFVKSTIHCFGLERHFCPAQRENSDFCAALKSSCCFSHFRFKVDALLRR